jgi:flavin reductase (DIM6/NTAB) family NADH-FMN oxidoreductase RutF
MMMKKSLGPQSILYPTPTVVIATYDPEGRPNMMAASWAGVCCSSPPMVSVSLRPATYSHNNIKMSKAFCVCVPSQDHWREADHVGIVSGRNTLKFQTTGLTVKPSEHVDAPYIEEFPLVLECKLHETHDLGTHTQFIGEVVNVLVDEDVLDKEDNVDIKKLRPIIFSPGSSLYHGVGKLIGKARTNRKLDKEGDKGK